MFSVMYIKKFVSGSLEGITYDEVVSFDNLEIAKGFAEGLGRYSVNPVKAYGGSDYTCHCVRVVQKELRVVNGTY